MQLPLALVCVSAILLPGASAQAPSASDAAVTAADKAYNAQDWSAAESQYSGLTSRQPESARFWYRLGFSARANKHYDVALQAMQKAKALGAGKGLPVPLADYEIASTYAAMGNNSLALEFLNLPPMAASCSPPASRTTQSGTPCA
jgi:tetratricopeptide (TPR) repeat protein